MANRVDVASGLSAGLIGDTPPANQPIHAFQPRASLRLALIFPIKPTLVGTITDFLWFFFHHLWGFFSFLTVSTELFTRYRTILASKVVSLSTDVPLHHGM